MEVTRGSHSTGPPPAAALDIIDAFTSSHSSISVEVRTNKSITAAELEEAIPEVHDALYKAPEVIDALTSFDPKTAQIKSTVVLKSTAPDSVVDDLQAIAEKRLVGSDERGHSRQHFDFRDPFNETSHIH